MFEIEEGIPVTDNRAGRHTYKVGANIRSALETLKVGQSFHIDDTDYARVSVRARVATFTKGIQGIKRFVCNQTEEGIRVHRVE